MLRASCVLADQEEGRREGAAQVVVRLLDKARAMDRALRLVASGDLRPGDMAVLWFLFTGIDNQSGECIRRYRAIAAGCGMSRSSVGEALKRLKVAGVIEAKARHTERGSQIATAFSIKPAKPSERGTPVQPAERPPSGGPDTNSSRLSILPLGKEPSQQSKAEVDWDEHASWLATAGRYAKNFGYGGEGLAADDLERWRREKGDGQILAAIARAKERGLYDRPLIDFLERTYPRRRGAVA